MAECVIKIHQSTERHAIFIENAIIKTICSNKGCPEEQQHRVLFSPILSGENVVFNSQSAQFAFADKSTGIARAAARKKKSYEQAI